MKYRFVAIFIILACRSTTGAYAGPEDGAFCESQVESGTFLLSEIRRDLNYRWENVGIVLEKLEPSLHGFFDNRRRWNRLDHRIEFDPALGFFKEDGRAKGTLRLRVLGEIGQLVHFLPGYQSAIEIESGVWDVIGTRSTFVRLSHYDEVASIQPL